MSLARACMQQVVFGDPVAYQAGLSEVLDEVNVENGKGQTMSDKEDRIRQRAYEKWQKEGESHGWHDRHWSEAEAEVSAEDQPLPSDASATPMMDDAGMPSDDEIKSDAGASAASAAVAGVDTKKSRAPAAAKKPAAKKSKSA